MQQKNKSQPQQQLRFTITIVILRPISMSHN